MANNDMCYLKKIHVSSMLILRRTQNSFGVGLDTIKLASSSQLFGWAELFFLVQDTLEDQNILCPSDVWWGCKVLPDISLGMYNIVIRSLQAYKINGGMGHTFRQK